MSYTVIDNEIIRADLKATQKIVLITILSYHNKEKGYSYPSHSDLMKDCCIKDKNTLIKAIKDLEALGYLKKETIKGVGNRYYIEGVGENKTTEKISSVKNPTTPVGKTQLEVCEKPNTINTKTNTKKNTNIYSLVIDYLNRKASTNYRASTKNTQSFINARLKEGFIVEDFKKVIDYKAKDWLNTEYEKYLRPSTLFGTKFENYLNEANKKEPIAVGSNENKNNKVNPSICNNRRKYTQTCIIK